ncbi:hypothetical protein HNY73_011306 [Argiope bruennichi]|uniref:DUF5641 domain-containing protein n=1 Tax=Argiope bruennichi TaxID=94029 RepID=A0A8T0F4N1_ARGBR|nr:hypothetical protein HNY73_011306 [Argiope bruennichi]
MELVRERLNLVQKVKYKTLASSSNIFRTSKFINKEDKIPFCSFEDIIPDDHFILYSRLWLQLLKEMDLTPITPAMFLCDNPTSETTDLDVLDGNHFSKRLELRAKMIQVLRERFRKEYLGQLIQCHRQHPQSSNIHIGDILLIGDNVKKRLQGPLARVIELIPGKDGHVRTVRVKTQQSTLVRPIKRMFPLEVSGSDFQKQLGPSAD